MFKPGDRVVRKRTMPPERWAYHNSMPTNLSDITFVFLRAVDYGRGRFETSDNNKRHGHGGYIIAMNDMEPEKVNDVALEVDDV